MIKKNFEKNIFIEIFRAGSRTYFYSSKFFPKETKKEVEVLYGLVRTVDDFVDTIPQNKLKFVKFKRDFFRARKGKYVNSKIIREFIALEEKKKFDKKWIEAFFESMEMDLSGKKLKTMKEIEKYIYGSAEVIGLFMARIIGVNKKAHKCARTLGKAMQYINFIRDIEEDILLKRNYFPIEDYNKCKILEGNIESMKSNKDGFRRFINTQLNRYYSWQKEAEKGYKYLPKKYFAPVKTAADMYKWTAKVIEKDPKIVLKKKVKPSQLRVLASGALNSLGQTSIVKEL